MYLIQFLLPPRDTERRPFPVQERLAAFPGRG
jgi:hypothetical protein